MVSGHGINRQGALDARTRPNSTAVGAPAVSAAGAAGLRSHPERNPLMPRDDDRRRVERSYLRFAGVGVEFAATIVVLTVLGIWLDGRLGTGPLFTIVLLLIGFAGATWNLVRTVLGPDRSPGEPDHRV